MIARDFNAFWSALGKHQNHPVATREAYCEARQDPDVTAKRILDGWQRYRARSQNYYLAPDKWLRQQGWLVGEPTKAELEAAFRKRVEHHAWMLHGRDWLLEQLRMTKDELATALAREDDRAEHLTAEIRRLIDERDNKSVVEFKRESA